MAVLIFFFLGCMFAFVYTGIVTIIMDWDIPFIGSKKDIAKVLTTFLSMLFGWCVGSLFIVGLFLA